MGSLDGDRIAKRHILCSEGGGAVFPKSRISRLGRDISVRGSVLDCLISIFCKVWKGYYPYSNVIFRWKENSR